MSNLSDLLPAGASAKSITATDSGSGIAINTPVILETAGTVTEVAVANTSNSPSMPTGVATTFTTETPEQLRLVFDPFDSTRFIVTWNTDVGSPRNIVKLRVGTITGTSITLNTETTVYGTSASGYASAAFDPNNENVFVVTYKDESSTGQAKVGTISGSRGSESVAYGAATEVTSVTLGGTPTQLNANVQFVHGSSEKFILYYTNTSSNYPYAVVFTYSGTTITSGTPTIINSSAVDQDYGVLAVNTETEGNFVAAYVKTDSYLYVKSGNISGTTITMDSNETQAYTPFANANIGGINWCNGTSDSFLVSTKGNLGYATFIAGTLTGTTFAFGTPVQSNSSNITVMSTSTSISDAGVGGSYGGHEFIATYEESGDTYLRAVPINVVGTTVTNGTAVIMVSANTDKNGVTPFGGMGDSVEGTFAITYRLNTATTDGVIRLGDAGGDTSSSNLTATNFLGIADEAISASASGVIVVQGGTATYPAQPALNAGDPVQFESGSNSYNASVFDSNANKIVAFYDDTANSNYGTAAVGTVSGMTSTWGTPVVFNSANSSFIAAAFDSDANKTVTVYRDAGNSYYGTAIVGTVSGTSISFGTEADFNAASTTNIGIGFDSTANKVVVAFRDDGNSDYGTAVVGTVSGTGISFGAEATFQTNQTSLHHVVYDPDENKTVLVYKHDGNSSYGTSNVCTVTGTSIAFGADVIFKAASADPGGAVYDTAADKVVIAYGISGAANAIVGTVSGTSISYGAEAEMIGTSTSVKSAAFDSTANETMVAFVESVTTFDGWAIAGTVSGTSISFGTSLNFTDPNNANNIATAYDSNADRTVFTYKDTPEADCRAVVLSATTTLTIGSNYYVQPAGTLATSAGSPSVKAGLAISTTSLLLSGDS